jgi:16S rRNA (guanine(527)-N(7))-methyltransferase RsmG
VFRELLRRKLEGILSLGSDQVEALEHHYKLLVLWNRSLNLTSIESEEEIVERHYCESLFLASHLSPGALRIADAGSGAGFPGIPVAVFRPDCHVTLIESHQRKAVFLREATRQTKNIKVFAKRAEAVSERYDLVISRAVGYEGLLTVLRKMAPFVDLLTGEEAPPTDAGFEWQPPLRLPWGEHRYLRMAVSRETINHRFT